MTVHLPEELERFVHDQVRAGLYRSEDEAITEAVRLLRQRDQVQGEPDARERDVPRPKPIWEVAAEIRRSIPAEEWAKLPIDGAEQHDHYIYGSPKRPTSR